MQPSLEHDYDTLHGLLQCYDAYVRRFLYRFIMLGLRRTGEAFKVIRDTDYLSSRQSPVMVAMIEECARDEDKTSKWYPVLTAEWRIDALAGVVRKEIPQTDFGALRSLHELKGKELARFRPVTVLGGILGASALLLKTVPKGVFPVQGVSYETFEVVVFWVTFAALVYVTLILTMEWVKHSRAKRRHARADYLLEYLRLTSPKPGAE